MIQIHTLDIKNKSHRGGEVREKNPLADLSSETGFLLLYTHMHFLDVASRSMCLAIQTERAQWKDLLRKTTSG